MGCSGAARESQRAGGRAVKGAEKGVAGQWSAGSRQPCMAMLTIPKTMGAWQVRWQAPMETSGAIMHLPQRYQRQEDGRRGHAALEVGARRAGRVAGRAVGEPGEGKCGRRRGPGPYMAVRASHGAAGSEAGSWLPNARLVRATHEVPRRQLGGSGGRSVDHACRRSAREKQAPAAARSWIKSHRRWSQMSRNVVDNAGHCRALSIGWSTINCGSDVFRAAAGWRQEGGIKSRFSSRFDVGEREGGAANRVSKASRSRLHAHQPPPLGHQLTTCSVGCWVQCSGQGVGIRVTIPAPACLLAGNAFCCAGRTASLALWAAGPAGLLRFSFLSLACAAAW